MSLLMPSLLLLNRQQADSWGFWPWPTQVSSWWAVTKAFLRLCWQRPGSRVGTGMKAWSGHSFRVAQSACFLQLRAAGNCGCRQPASWIHRNHRAAYFQLKGQVVHQSHHTKSLLLITCCCVFKIIASPISNLLRQHQQNGYTSNLVLELEHHKVVL